VDQTQVVNAALIIALMLLAVSSLLLVASMMPLINQGVRTLNAVEDLAETVNREIPPTLLEVREIMDGLDQIRSSAAKNITQVSTKIEDVSGSVNHAVSSASKNTSVFGAGIFAGVKAFFAGNHDHAHQITADRTVGSTTGAASKSAEGEKNG
jgi:predicted PurR-regulated permease PerM